MSLTTHKPNISAFNRQRSELHKMHVSVAIGFSPERTIDVGGGHTMTLPGLPFAQKPGSTYDAGRNATKRMQLALFGRRFVHD